MSAIAESYNVLTRRNRMGMWLFFLSETFIFGGLLVARFFLWGNTRPSMEDTVIGPLVIHYQIIPLLITAVLLISSFFMNRAEVAIANDDIKGFSRSIILTAILGTIFLLGVLVFEWGWKTVDGQFVLGRHISPTDGVFGAVLYGMTGMHALHVASGIVLLLIVWNLGRKGKYSAKNHWGVEATAIYWHYVDLVWVFFYPALYLIGVGVHAAAH